MTHKTESSFDIVKRMVRDHLKDAEGARERACNEVGPTVDQSYTAAYSTATGAYAGRGITASQWAELHQEVRDHKAAFQVSK